MGQTHSTSLKTSEEASSLALANARGVWGKVWATRMTNISQTMKLTWKCVCLSEHGCSGAPPAVNRISLFNGCLKVPLSSAFVPRYDHPRRGLWSCTITIFPPNSSDYNVCPPREQNGAPNWKRALPRPPPSPALPRVFIAPFFRSASAAPAFLARNRNNPCFPAANMKTCAQSTSTKWEPLCGFEGSNVSGDESSHRG